VRSTNHEATRGVEPIDSFFVQVLLRDNRFDDVLLEVRTNLFVGNGFVVL
jgi:hypothetical protein